MSDDPRISPDAVWCCSVSVFKGLIRQSNGYSKSKNNEIIEIKAHCCFGAFSIGGSSRLGR